MKSSGSFIVFSIFCFIFLSQCRKKDCPFPVITHPTIKHILLKPGSEGKDAMVMSINPNYNYGNYAGNIYAIAGTWSSIPGSSRIYMQFDYSAIPANALIQSVMLKLYADTINGAIVGQPKGHCILSPNNAYVKRITSPWDEFTITWNNQPSSDNSGRLELPPSTSLSQAYNIDITQFAKDELANPSAYHGIMIQVVDETPYRGVVFRSSDDTIAPMLRPELNITYIE